MIQSLTGKVFTFYESSRSLFGKIKKSDALRKAGFLFASRSVNSFLSLLFSLMAGRYLTVEDHGLYGKSLAGIVVFQAILELGMQFTVVRFLAPAIKNKDEATIRSITRASLRLKAIAMGLTTGLLLGFIGLVSLSVSLDLHFLSSLTTFSNPSNLALLWLVFLGGAGMSMVSYLDSILVSHEAYYRLASWVPSVGIMRIALLLFLYFMEQEGLRSEHVLYAYVIPPFLSIAIFFILFPPGFFTAEMKNEGTAVSDWMRKLIGFNSWIMLASIMSIVSDWIEVLMITDPRQTGLYNAARLPMQGFLIILSTMQAMILPRFSGLKKPEEFLGMFKRIYKWVVALSVAVIPGLFVFAMFIPFWYGQSYHSSIDVLYVLYPGFVMRLFFAPLGVALFALDRPRIIAIEAALHMVTGILLNLILIPMAGITGAAWSALLSQISGWIFLLYCYAVYFRTGMFPSFESPGKKET